MRTARIGLSALLLAGALSVAAAAQPPAMPALMQPALNAAIAVGIGGHGTVGVDFFYSHLAPYGYWVNRPNYGWAWVPRHVRHGWRPYSSGRWAYTDYGWTWVSSEPFGWATYHYGRWNVDPDYGWEWVPGTDWGPAWVSWQEGNGYCGWAPLPPAVGWSAGVGLDLGGFNLGAGIDPGWYSFVPERFFLAGSVGGFIVSPSRNVEIFRNTTNVTNFRNDGGRVFNGAFSTQHIAQVTGQPVRQFRLANANDPRAARVSGNSVAMFRPAAVVRQANGPDPTRVAPRSVATGRIAQQLVQQRRSEAAQFRLAGNQGQEQRPLNAGARTAQAAAGRRAAGMTTAQEHQRQAQAPRRSAPTGRQQQALGRRQSTPAGRHQQSAQTRQTGRSQRAQTNRQSFPAGRRAQQQPGARSSASHRQAQQAQARRQSAPARNVRQQSPSRGPSATQQRQQQAQSRRQSAPPPQRQQQVMRQSAPPQRQAQFQRQSPPSRPQRQASPVQQRQAPARNQAPPPRQQRQRENPPPGGR